MAETASHKGLDWGMAHAPAANRGPPYLGGAPWRVLAGRERLARRQRRQWVADWYSWLVLGVGISIGLIFIAGLAHVLSFFQAFFREMLGDEPLPVLTNLYLLLTHFNRPWLQVLVGGSLLGASWYFLRPRQDLGPVALARQDWWRCCQFMSQVSPEAADQSRTRELLLAQLQVPGIKAQVEDWLWPASRPPTGSPALPRWAAAPTPLRLLREHAPGRPTPSQWAATAALLASAELKPPRATDRWAWLLYGALILLLLNTVLALINMVPTLAKLLDCLCG